MSEKKLGIGFIGAGEVSILHGRALRLVPNARLVGLWDINAEEARRRAGEEGCSVYATPERLMEDEEVEAVFVLTNLETHLQFARMAMEAGKDVLLEKPICASVAEVTELQKVVERTGRICVPGHNMIHEESLRRAHRLIADGEIGDVVTCYVMYNIYHSDERASTLPGVVRHLLTHALYTMMYLAGRPTRVTAFKQNRNHPGQPEKEDLAMVLLELENGGIAHLSVSFAADDLGPAPWTYTAKVIGTAGTTHYTYQDWVEVKKGISHSHTYTAYQDTITNEDHAFAELCLTREGRPLSDLEDALWAQKTTEAVEESIERGVAVPVR